LVWPTGLDLHLIRPWLTVVPEPPVRFDAHSGFVVRLFISLDLFVGGTVERGQIESYFSTDKSFHELSDLFGIVRDYACPTQTPPLVEQPLNISFLFLFQ
jgi:hypothetical protein